MIALAEGDIHTSDPVREMMPKAMLFVESSSPNIPPPAMFLGSPGAS
jgi:hypothetical protein